MLKKITFVFLVFFIATSCAQEHPFSVKWPGQKDANMEYSMVFGRLNINPPEDCEIHLSLFPDVTTNQQTADEHGRKSVNLERGTPNYRDIKSGLAHPGRYYVFLFCDDRKFYEPIRPVTVTPLRLFLDIPSTGVEIYMGDIALNIDTPYEKKWFGLVKNPVGPSTTTVTVSDNFQVTYKDYRDVYREPPGQIPVKSIVRRY